MSSKRTSKPPERFDPTPEGVHGDLQMMSERVKKHRKKIEDRDRKREERNKEDKKGKEGDKPDENQYKKQKK